MDEISGCRRCRFFEAQFLSQKMLKLPMTELRLVGMVFLLFSFGLVSRTDAQTKPNIVIIMADDLGYGDVSCYGAKSVATPNIDRLATAGVRFTSGYTSGSTCTPTRYSFMTGVYAFRTANTGIAPPNAPAIIAPGTPTIASLLKSVGYRTAVVGKWHLGLGTERPDWNGELKPGPLEIGFDRCLVLPTTNDRVPQVLVQDHHVRNLDPNDPLSVSDKKPSDDHPTGLSHRDTLKLNWSHGHNATIHNGISRIGFYTGGEKARFRDEDLADTWVQESVAWIEANKAQPFFLFLASHDLHVPRTPHERFQGATKMGARGDAIVEFDWCVGEITKTIERLGLAENTLIIVCSDNGPVLDDGYQDSAVELLGDHKPAGPWRGGKGSVFEGGTRAPFIASWKGRIAPAAVSDRPITTLDLGASLASIVGAKLPSGACRDAIDLSGTLLNSSAAKGRRFVVQQDNGARNLGLRMGDWKLIRNRGADGKKDAKPQRDQLFNLKSDPGETQDLSETRADELQRLQTKLDEVLAAGEAR
jgi:arylsulfatase A-like enzyme